ncbi:MAG: (Fe-S)-binding protein [Proteobacteria bacterium]|nr:(Fe-S)-binding protein [Pseudomonadota bacterium]
MKKRNIKYTENFQGLLSYLSAGRTLEKQLECIEETGNHAPAWLLRAGLLRALGVPAPKEKAENFLTFGCYVPFWSPAKLRDTLKLLDLLEIEYNYSPEKEVCCGALSFEDSIELVEVSEEQREKVQSKCKEFMQKNWDLGKESGAKNMVYVCHACAALVKNTFPEDTGTHRWVYDAMMDKLEEKYLEMAPAKMGYFEGCHKYFPFMGNLDWPRYHKVLDSIKGLTLVDLDNRYCCKRQPEKILEDAEKKNLNTILVPCGDGIHLLKQASQGKMEIKSLAELLLQVLGE